MEVVEQYCQVVMNHQDDVVTSIGGTTAKLTYQSFAFGFVELHGPPRSMWYDDVAFSTTHLACP